MFLIVVLALGMFTVGSSSFMMAGLLPKISLSISQPIAITGQGITAFGITYLISAPIFSIFFSHMSAKKLLQFSLLIFISGNLVTLQSNNLVTFIFGRILTGLGAGIFNPFCVSLAVQLAGENSRGKVLSLIWGANSAGVVFGVPIGIYIATKFSWHYSLAYILTLAFIVLILISSQNIKSIIPSSSNFKKRIELISDKKVLSIIFITCITATASLGLYSYISLVLKTTENVIAKAIFFWGLGGFIGSSSIGHLVDKIKRPQVAMLIVLVGLMVSIASIPVFINIDYFKFIPFFLWGAFGWSMPTPQQHALFDLYQHDRSVLSALNSSAIGMGSAFGTSIGGTILSAGIDPKLLPIYSATLLLSALVFQYIIIKNKKSETKI